MGNVHPPKTMNVHGTNIMESGQSTTFSLCTNQIEIKEQSDHLLIRTTPELKRTQKALRGYGMIRLHKIVSNNVKVMKSFDSSNMEKNLKDLNRSSDILPLQRSFRYL